MACVGEGGAQTPPRLGTGAKVLQRSWETVILLVSGGKKRPGVD